MENQSVLSRINLWWQDWITPRSQDINEAFLERVLRGLLPFWILYVSMYFIRGFVLGDILKFPLSAILVGIGDGLIVWFILQRRYVLASYLLPIMAVFISMQGVLKFGYWDPTVSGGIIITSIIAGVILPNIKWVIFSPFFLTIVFGAGAFWNSSNGLVSPLPRTAAFSHPLTSTITLGAVLLLGGALLYYARDQISKQREALLDLVISLKASQNRFNTFMDHNPTLVYIRDSDGRFTYINKMAANVSSNPEDKIIGATIDELLPASVTQIIHKADETVLSEKQSIEIKDLPGLVHPKKWFQLIQFPITDELGNIHIGGIGIDITDYKTAEKLLQESETRYRMLTELISDYTFSGQLDADGKYVVDWYSQDELQRLTGHDKPVNDLRMVHPDDIKSVEEIIKKAVQGYSSKVECRFFTKTGELKWASVSAQGVWNEEDQKYSHFLGAVQDITERKEAENVLRENEERYRIISELITDAAFSVEILENGLEKPEWIIGLISIIDNEIWLSNNDPFNVVHPNDLTDLKADIQKTIKGLPTDGVYRVFDPTGKIRWLRIKRTPIWDEQQERVIRYYGAIEDITEQKQAEDALLVSNNQLRTLLDTIPDQILIFDEDGRYLFKHIGHHPTFEYTFPPIDKLIHDIDNIPEYIADLVLKNVRQAIKLDELQVIEYQHITSANLPSVEWTEGRALSLHNTVNGRRTALWVGRDITERKQAEKALRASNNQLQALINAIPDQILIFDEDGRYLFKHIGHHPTFEHTSSLVGKLVHDVDTVPEYIADLVLKNVRQAIKLDELQVIEYQYITSANPPGVEWVEGRTLSLHNTVNGKRTALWVTRNIKERKVAEKALRESEARYRRLFDSIPIGLFQLTPDGRYIDANLATISILGYPDKETLMTINEKELYVDVTQREIWQNILEQDNHITVFSTQFCRYDGTVIWIELSLSVIKDDFGLVTSYEGALKDITNRKKREQAIITLNTELEERVTQRTLDLTLTNKQLSDEVARRQSSEKSEIRQRLLAEALLDTAIVLTSTLDMDDVINQILLNINSVVDFEFGLVFLLDDNLTPVAQRGYSTAEFEEIQHLTTVISKQGILFQSLIHEPSVNISHQDVEILNSPFNEHLIISAMRMPILVDDNIIGIIILGSRKISHFEHENIHIMKSFARQVGVAIENARRLSQSRKFAIMEERNRLARDLHDTISQNLWSLKIIADILPQLWEKQLDVFWENVEDLGNIAQTTLAEMRSLLLELQPQFLEETPLNKLIENITRSVSSKLGVIINFECNISIDIPTNIKTAFYRIAQESLNNITRHANPQSINIELIETPKQIELIIDDDGIGFDSKYIPPDHMGIRNMRQRAENIGAFFAITSSEGIGTKIKLKWSFEEDKTK